MSDFEQWQGGSMLLREIPDRYLANPESPPSRYANCRPRSKRIKSSRRRTPDARS